MDHLRQDLRYAARMLTKNPAFTTVAVLVLALGIGANTAMFALTNSVLLRPIEADNPSELVALYNKHTTRPDSYRGFSYPNFEDIRAQNTALASVMAHDLTVVGLTEGDVTRRIFAEFASYNYFDTFGVSAARGRFFTAAEEKPGSAIPVAVVSYEYWRKRGADPGMVGSTITVNAQPLTIVGVAPRYFAGRSALLSPGLYLPFGMHHLLMNDMFTEEGQDLLDERDNHRLFLVGRLAPGVTMEDADAQLGALAAGLGEAFPAANGDHTIVVGSLSRLSISTEPSDDAQVGLVAVMLLAMTGIVLLIACINLANMLLARGATRRREFAIRAAIGGGRARIVRQLLTEGLMLSALGGIAGLVAALWANNMLAASMGQLMARSGFSMDIVLRSGIDLRILAATVAFCTGGTLLFGLGPAWKQSRPDVMADLKQQAGASGGRSKRRLFAQRNILVVSQVALSMVLLTSAGLFVRASMEAASVDPGFRLDNALLVEVDPSLVGYDEPRTRELYRVLHERLTGIDGVETASVAATVPFGSVSSGQSVRRAEDLPGTAAGGADEIETVGATANIVGADYFETLGVPVLRGRGFTLPETESDGGPRVAIVDELLAEQLWPGEDPIGRQIGFGRDPGDRGDDMEVVGVVATVRDDLFPNESRPHVYTPFGQNFQAGMNIHLRTSPMDGERSAEVLQAVRGEIRALDPRLPVMMLKTLRGHIGDSAGLWIVRLGATIFTAFGFLALFLSVVGVYGVKAYTVAQRAHEIGIRKALGATSHNTVWLFVREGSLLTGVGLALGVLLSAGAAQLLGSILYAVSAFDPIAFIAAPTILAAASLLATWLPARRAARIDAITALRQQN